MAHAATYTWTGAAAAAANPPGSYGTDDNWSDAGNWTSGAAPTAGVTGSFAFPGAICPTTFATCFGGIDDLAGVTADGLTISSDGGYYVTNDGYPSANLTLEQTGSGDALDAVNDAPGTTGTTRFYVPMTLVGNQTWTIDGNGSGIGNGLTLGNTVTGAGTVSVALDGDATFDLLGGAAPDSFASLTVNGAAQSGQGNAFDVGSLSLTGSDLTLYEGGSLTSSGTVSLDPTDTLGFELDKTGQSTPGLVTSGNVALQGKLSLLLDIANGESSSCPRIPLGTSDTLIQSTGGSVSGTFEDTNGNPIANGGYAEAIDQCGPADADADYWYQLAYTRTSVTATAVSAKQATTPPPAAGTGVSTVATPVSKRGSSSVTVPIACAAGGASCTVTVKVTAVEKVKNKKGKSVKNTVTIGTKTVTVAAGATAKPVIKLTKAGKALLAKDKKLATKVVVTSKTATGTNKTTTKKLTLSAAKAKAKAKGTPSSKGSKHKKGKK